jgi:uncharacterized protein (DUF2235 family)
VKRILICLDGTWNADSDTASPHATNVARLHQSALHFLTPNQQTFYLPGVGTRVFEKIRGGVLGYGLFEQIKDAYLEIVNHYSPGDRVIIAGFSRGAFSARCLASFVATCGVLRNHSLDLGDLRDKVAIDHLWELYAQRDPSSPQLQPQLQQFVTNYCHPALPCPVEAVAVWDTVGALGIPWEIFPQNAAGELLAHINERKYRFLDPRLPRSIPRAYHALALDEQRKPFQPTLFAVEGPRLNDGSIQQVWFAGAHSNVGGGFEDTRLSDITLDWMIRQLSRNHRLNLRMQAVGDNAAWAPVGQTDMDQMAEKVEATKTENLQLLEPRRVPAGALLHPTADLRMRGRPGQPGIPTRAVFEGPCRIWHDQPHHAGP